MLIRVQPNANPNQAYPVQPNANPNRGYPVQPTANPNRAFQVHAIQIYNNRLNKFSTFNR